MYELKLDFEIGMILHLSLCGLILLYHSFEVDTVCKVFMLIWGIWTNRNKVVWDNAPSTSTQIVSLVLSALQARLQARHCSEISVQSSHDPHVVRWMF